MTMTTDQIIQRLIDQDIYVNASTMVSELSSGLTLNSASFAELWPECLESVDYSEAPEGYFIDRYTVKGMPGVPEDRILWQWSKECREDEDPETEDGFSSEHEAIEAAWDHSGDEVPYTEALQHWLVSDWLADKLEQVGAPIARDVLGFNVWGRTECGQSLTMDAALHRVAAIIEEA